MKHFTRERYLAMQNSQDEAAQRCDEDWEAAVEGYDAYLQGIRPELPESVRQLLDGFYLHDAAVLSLGQRGDQFLITLRLDSLPSRGPASDPQGAVPLEGRVRPAAVALR